MVILKEMTQGQQKKDHVTTKSIKNHANYNAIFGEHINPSYHWHKSEFHGVVLNVFELRFIFVHRGNLPRKSCSVLIECVEVSG